jgi:4-hydroxybenzoate polyprenyltransferase
VAFDREHGVHSLPARFGLGTAFIVARTLHAAMIAGLFLLGVTLGLAWPYTLGCVMAAGLLLYEHRVLSPDDLSAFPRIFVRVNGMISLSLLVGTLAAVLSRG